MDTSKFLHALNFFRSGLYSIESLPLRVAHRLLKGDTDEKDSGPKVTQAQFKFLFDKITVLFKREEQLLREGVYDWRAFELGNPVRHIKSYVGVFHDGFGQNSRRLRKQHRVFGKRADLSGLPEYYLRNFHFQTDGYLSEASARRYDHQVEILFSGTAATIRRQVIPLLKQFANPGERWLDLGCGAGSSTRGVAATFPKTHIVGVDLSNPYIKVAQDKLRKFPRTTFMQGDGTDLAFKTDTFGAVYSIYCLHELPQKEREKFVREAYRVVKPGGILIMADSLQVGDDPEVDFFLEQFPRFFHEPFFKNYSQNSLETLMTKISGVTAQTELVFNTKFVYVIKPSKAARTPKA